MPVSADTVGLHLAYTASAAQLSPEELTRDFKTADRSVLDTPANIYAATASGFTVKGEPPATFIGLRSQPRQRHTEMGIVSIS